MQAVRLDPPTARATHYRRENRHGRDAFSVEKQYRRRPMSVRHVSARQGAARLPQPRLAKLSSVGRSLEPASLLLRDGGGTLLARPRSRYARRMQKYPPTPPSPTLRTTRRSPDSRPGRARFCQRLRKPKPALRPRSQVVQCGPVRREHRDASLQAKAELVVPGSRRACPPRGRVVRYGQRRPQRLVGAGPNT